MHGERGRNEPAKRGDLQHRQHALEIAALPDAQRVDECEYGEGNTRDQRGRDRKTGQREEVSGEEHRRGG